MTNEPWAHIGISDESQFVELLFDSYSESLIAKFWRHVADNHYVNSLYLRAIQGPGYRRLTGKSDTLSYEDAVLSPSGPFMFVNILEAQKDGEKYSGYDWYALQKLKLPEGEVVSEVRDGQLPGKLDGQKTWISKLHGASKDGNTIYCTIGIPEREAKSSIKMRYHLAALHVENKSFKLITGLKDVFL